MLIVHDSSGCQKIMKTNICGTRATERRNNLIRLQIELHPPSSFFQQIARTFPIARV